MKKIQFATALSLACAMNLSALADDMITPPEEVGVSSDRLEFVDSLITNTLDTHGIPGMSVIISRHGKVFYTNASGSLGLNRAGPLKIDSIHRMYSMTKAVTAVAALILYEEGAFHLHDPVAKHLPEFKDQKVLVDGELMELRQAMTVHHLFTHTSGLGYGYHYSEVEGYADLGLDQAKTSDEFVKKLSQLPLLSEPGSAWRYSYSSDVLGILVERLSGQSLGEFMSERIFSPLGMADTFFSLPADKHERLVSNYFWKDGSLQPASEPPFATGYRTTAFDAGGAGLLSTAPDYLKFLEMLRQGGSVDGVRILGPKTIGFMLIDHLPEHMTKNNVGPDHNPTLGLGAGHGLGIGIYIDPVRRGVLSSPGEVDWGGVAGTIYWYDPMEDIIVVGMSQTFHPRPYNFRDDLAVALYQALTITYEYENKR